MSSVDFSNYKFRASSMPTLMTKSRSKSDILSETAKSLLHEIYIEAKYGRKKVLCTKYLEKGTNQENESISLYRKYTQNFFQKNERKYENDFLCGTPDIILDDCIVDIKTSWDIFTFSKVDRDQAYKDYYYQLATYMILTGKTKARLVYCLVNNDEWQIYSELQKIRYMKGLDDSSPILEEYEQQIRLNNTYDDIPLSERIKVFDFDFDGDDLEKILNTLQECRKYLVEHV